MADVIQKAGAWFSYGERRLAQGRDNVKELLKNEPELAEEIEKKIMENVDKISVKPAKKKGAKGKGKKGSTSSSEADDFDSDDTSPAVVESAEPEAESVSDIDAGIDIMVED